MEEGLGSEAAMFDNSNGIHRKDLTLCNARSIKRAWWMRWVIKKEVY
jgi:hypothetical protein